MGLFDKLKLGLNSSKKKEFEEHSFASFNGAKLNLKQASEFLGKFLDGVKDFQPARRHAEIYEIEVKEKIVRLRASLRNAIVFLDERSRNTVNTLNSLKSPEQLRNMIEGWIKLLDSGDENVPDILKILQIEMWSSEKLNRGFPAPTSKDLVCGYLITAVNYLREARNHLNEHLSISEAPDSS